MSGLIKTLAIIAWLWLASIMFVTERADFGDVHSEEN
jgi:hypothetical protein